MKQYYALLIFFVFEYVRPGIFIPILEVLRVHTALAMLLFIVSFSSNKLITNDEVLKKPNTILFLVFLFLVVISVLTAGVTYYAFVKFKVVLGYLLIYYIMIKQITDIIKLKGVLIILILVHLFIVAISPDIVLNPETRSYLTGAPFLGDGNDFALSVSIVLPFCYFFFMDGKKRFYKILSIIIFVLLTLCIIGTSSRGGFLSLSGVILYLLFKSRSKLKGLIVVGGLALVIIAFAPSIFYERIETIKDYEQESSAAVRIMVWKQAFEMAKANPILGVGAGNFPYEFGTKYRPPGYPERGGIQWLNAHSTFFLALGEFGFPGISILLLILIVNIVRNEKHIRWLKGNMNENMSSFRRLFISLNAGIIGFSIGGFFLSALYYPHLYVLAGLSAAAELSLEKSTKPMEINDHLKSINPVVVIKTDTVVG